MGKKNILLVILFCLILCILGTCQQDSTSEYLEASRESNIETSPKSEIINSETLQYKEIEIGWFAEKIVFGKEYLWILKRGELVKQEIQEPYRQDFFKFPSSLGAGDMLFDGQYLWTTSTQPDSSNSYVSKFDPQKEMIVNETAVPDPISVTFGKNIIWVSDFLNSQVIKLDSIDGRDLGTMPLDFASQKIGFGDDKIWALNTQDNEVAVFNTQNGEKIATYTTGKVPLDMAFDNDRIWITNLNDNYLTYIPFSLPGSSAKLPIHCPAQPACNINAIEITDVGTFISSTLNDVVYRIDLDTGQILNQYIVSAPVDLAYDGSHIWVINGNLSRTDMGHTLTRIQP